MRFAAALAALLLLCCNALAEGQLPYRFAGREEGVELLLRNGAYYAGFNQTDLDYRAQRKGATLDEWKAFAAEQVLDFSDEEQAAIGAAMDEIEAILAENGYQLPRLGELVFVRTTQLEEGGSDAYTLGNQMYLGASMTDSLRSEDAAWRRYGCSTLCHEIFHCLTRSNPEFRRDMYAILGFAVHDEEFELSPELRAICYSNPDVGRRDTSASFVIDGAERECFVALIAARPFEQPGDQFTEAVEPVLVPVDDPSAYFEMEEVENFWQVFGENTGYVLDPEECLADNFGYALMYEGADPDGNPFPNPEILDAIREYLKG